MNISNSFRLKLSKLSQVPPNQVDLYFIKSLRCLGAQFTLELIPLIAKKMNRLYKVDKNKEKELVKV
jgi:hypothetical protein